MSLSSLGLSQCLEESSVEKSKKMCGAHPCCWTRSYIKKEMKKNHTLQGVQLRTYQGVIGLFDPNNWWTKMKITKKGCSFTVSKNATNQYIVTASFLPQPVVLSISMSESNFFIGKIDEDHMLVLQQHLKGAALSHVSFSKDHILRYGHCSKDGFFIQECSNY